MVDRERVKEVRRERGQWAALKFALGQGKAEIDEEIGLSETYQEGKEAGKRKADDDPVRIVCRECRSDLTSADIARCPKCGYTPSAHAKWRWLNALAVGVLAVTVIGIPLAVIPYRKAQKHRKKQKQGVAEKQWS